jgi:hypothetical protein
LFVDVEFGRSAGEAVKTFLILLLTSGQIR